MANLYSQYESGLQLTAGIIAGSSLGTSGLNPIVDRLNSVAPAGSQISGAQVSIYGNFAGLIAGNGIDINNGSEIAGEAASTTNSGIIEVATSAEAQTGTDATRAISPDSLFDVSPPVGAIIGWAKTIAGIPQTLPTSWVECDGSTISDGASPIDGITLPNLNGDNRFLQGETTSGSTGGSATMAHTHTGTASGTTGAGSAHTHTQDGSVSADSHSHTLDSSGWAKIGAADGSYPQWLQLEGVASWTSTQRISAGTGTDASESQTYATGLGGATNSDSHSHNDTFSNANESSHTHSFSDGFTTSAASNTENRPPYYNVVWIMRIK